MKKILHLTHTDINTDSRILKEIATLSNAGHSINGFGVILEEGAASSDIKCNADIYSIILRSRRLKFLPKTLRHLMSLVELLFKMIPPALRLKPDVVHCHDTLVLPIGVIVKFFSGARLVYDAHELESDRNGLSKLQGRLTLLVERFSWRFIDGLIVVSPSIKQWYIENIGPKPSAIVLNSPSFDEADIADENYLRKKFNIPDYSLIFIYIGILGRGRGLEMVMQAFTNIKINSHVVFLGYGELSNSIKKMVDSNKNFHLHKAVPHSQVVPIARSADFGLCLVENVSLSDYLCLPNKLFEYCFAGLPVLASNFPDINKIVYEYGVGECCDLDVDSIITAVKKIENGSTNFEFKNLYPLTWQKQELNLIGLYDIFL